MDEPSHNYSCSKTPGAACAFTQSIRVPVAWGKMEEGARVNEEGVVAGGRMSKDQPDFSGVTNPRHA